MKKIIGKTIMAATILFVSCTSNSGDASVEKAAELFANEDYKNAIVELKKAADSDLSTYTKEDVFMMIGNSYSGLEDFDNAILYQKKALEINPNYEDALVNLGVIAKSAKQYDLAEKSFLKAKKVNPNNPEVYENLGEVYLYKNQPKLAVENLEKAIALNIKEPTVYSNLSVALAMVKKYDEAEKNYQKAIEMGYDDSDHSIRDYLNKIKQENE